MLPIVTESHQVEPSAFGGGLEGAERRSRETARWSPSMQSPDQIAADLKQARHQGALLLAESAAEKALLMYDWNKRGEFHLGFGSVVFCLEGLSSDVE